MESFVNLVAYTVQPLKAEIADGKIRREHREPLYYHPSTIAQDILECLVILPSTRRLEHMAGPNFVRRVQWKRDMEAASTPSFTIIPREAILAAIKLSRRHRGQVIHLMRR